MRNQSSPYSVPLWQQAISGDSNVAPKPTVSLKDATREAVLDLERKIILEALQANGWNRRQVARQLKIGYWTLLNKMKETGLAASTEPRSAREWAFSLKDVRRQAVRELEQKIILQALRAKGWNRKKVARELKVSYRTLLKKIKDNNLAAEGAPPSHRTGRETASLSPPGQSPDTVRDAEFLPC